MEVTVWYLAGDIKTIAQPFSRKGIYLYIVGSLSCAGSYINDQNYGADNMTKLLENNCTLVKKAHTDFDPSTGTFKTLNAIFKRLDKNPISIHTRSVIPNASLEFYLDYKQRVLCKKENTSLKETIVNGYWVMHLRVEDTECLL